MAPKALQWLAVDTYEPILQYYLHSHFELLLYVRMSYCAPTEPSMTRRIDIR
jgi:hypothetical protein